MTMAGAFVRRRVVSALLVTYDGFAFREGEEEPALPGRFRFTLGELQFEHASGTLELPLSRLVLDENACHACPLKFPDRSLNIREAAIRKSGRASCASFTRFFSTRTS